MQNNNQTLPLSMVNSGEYAELIAVQSGHVLQKRLADLGLNVGTQVRIVQSDPTGPMIVAFKDDARLAIGRGVAQKILVSLCAEEEPL